MKKRLGLTTLALGTALAILAPVTAMARDRDDYRGGDRDGWRGGEHHEYYRHYRDGDRWEHRDRDGDRWEHRDRDRDWDHDRDWRRHEYRNRYYSAPVVVNPPADGYYDQYGNWHPYAPQYYGY